MSTHIKKIVIYDFDNTLCISPENTDENRLIYEQKTGRSWPYKGQGWWSKDETLDHTIFDIKLNQPVKEALIKDISDVEVYTVLLTGRIPKFSSKIKEICRMEGVPYLDAYYFNDSHSTSTFKLSKLDFLKKEFPHVKNMVMWEDREEHIILFKKWGEDNYGSGFEINLVKI